ncbi:MAG: GAF domain-containing protein [Fimbriimonadaceae bacterium]|nr:GAF domain-containing protein [Fimbriimonadaceae bacterium]QYK58340.1 MAG: GAF domain-containing protein [Fimbriimonadaceae bacterium]
MTGWEAGILDAVRGSALTGFDLRMFAMRQLSGIDGFDWCGVYRLEDDGLVLDAYVGAPTDHDRIAVGVGVCGTAVAEGRNQVVADVRELDNYLACSLETRSEIVVLVKSGDEILGQIDIDGHRIGRFGPEEETFLDSLAVLLADRW